MDKMDDINNVDNPEESEFTIVDVEKTTDEEVTKTRNTLKAIVFAVAGFAVFVSADIVGKTVLNTTDTFSKVMFGFTQLLDYMIAYIYFDRVYNEIKKPTRSQLKRMEEEKKQEELNKRVK